MATPAMGGFAALLMRGRRREVSVADAVHELVAELERRIAPDGSVVVAPRPRRRPRTMREAGPRPGGPGRAPSCCARPCWKQARHFGTIGRALRSAYTELVLRLAEGYESRGEGGPWPRGRRGPSF